MITWLSKHMCATLPSSSCQARRGSETDTPTRRVPASLLRRALGRFRLLPSQAFNSSYSLTRRTLNVLCSSITCEHDLRLGLGGEYCQDRLLVRSGVAVPSCISNPPNILTSWRQRWQVQPYSNLTYKCTYPKLEHDVGCEAIEAYFQETDLVVSAKRSNVERVCDNGENSLLRLFIYKYLGIINICIRQI